MLNQHRWVNLDGRVPSEVLILTKVKFASSGETNLLPAPVVVANVLLTPTVEENATVIYQTAR